ncbi:MAG: hypothetical protein HC836_32985 [Richelia sp. RM2_1_2]|nr:hypothetical protein [Richelia sp. RM2_1_2]
MRDATLEVVTKIHSHGNADTLEICDILGYKSVTKMGTFQEGDIVIYVRPDSVFPVVPWAEPYRRNCEKRVKTSRLRGEWSEGVLIPLSALPDDLGAVIKSMAIGDDVGPLLNIFHYEPPIPQEMDAKGYLPFSIPKTDEEQYQNLEGKLPFGQLCDLDLKVDGMSTSFYYEIESKSFGVLGRELEMREEAVNNYTIMVDKYDIKNKLTEYCEKMKFHFVFVVKHMV